MHIPKLKKRNLRSLNLRTSASLELFREWRSSQKILGQCTPTSLYRLILLTLKIRKCKQSYSNSITREPKHLLRSIIRASKPPKKLRLAKLYKPCRTSTINNRKESSAKSLKSLKINNRESRPKERRWNFLKLSFRGSDNKWTTILLLIIKAQRIIKCKYRKYQKCNIN